MRWGGQIKKTKAYYGFTFHSLAPKATQILFF